MCFSMNVFYNRKFDFLKQMLDVTVTSHDLIFVILFFKIAVFPCDWEMVANAPTEFTGLDINVNTSYLYSIPKS